MRNLKIKAFTLVELLVVITILSIISVVAYQNFWGAVDKAISGRKISDVSTIETSLQQYKADKNYFPPTDKYSDTNLYWYSWAFTAQASNTIKVSYDWQEINTIVTSDTKWGWKVFWSWSLAGTQIWSKWTISRNTLTKKYLSKDLYDPEVWDIKVKTWNKKMIEYWIWRYVYAIYKKASDNKIWNDYNIAYTIKKENSDKYITRIVWSYDKESCYEDADNCPETLIWSSSDYLSDLEEQTVVWWVYSTTSSNYWIPYAVTDFTE